VTRSQPPRGHPTLAPAHLGEAASLAVLVLAVGGTALVITGAAMVVMGLTMGARYATTTPPPSISTLGLGPMLGGFGLAALGVLLVVGVLAVVADRSGARVATGLLAAGAGGLAAVGVLVAMSRPPADALVGVSLTVATLAFGVSAIILLRPAR
jgi:hypothetical protein